MSSLSFSNTGKHFTACSDGGDVRIWLTDQDNLLRFYRNEHGNPHQPFYNLKNSIAHKQTKSGKYAIVLIHDQLAVVHEYRKDVILWHFSGPLPMISEIILPNAICEMATSTDGRYLTAITSEGRARIWDLVSRGSVCIHELQAHTITSVRLKQVIDRVVPFEIALVMALPQFEEPQQVPKSVLKLWYWSDAVHEDQDRTIHLGEGCFVSAGFLPDANTIAAIDETPEGPIIRFWTYQGDSSRGMPVSHDKNKPTAPVALPITKAQKGGIRTRFLKSLGWKGSA